MEQVISSLIKRYETGGVSRRELVATLAALSVTGGSALAAAPAGFAGATINHVSITGSNLQRTVDFYSRTFGLERQGQGQGNLVQLKVGSQHLSIRQGAKPGFDHFAIGIERFNKDAVIADLKARGANPVDGGDGAGLHVADPDGAFVQVIAAGGTG